jgi:large subunit ribosomal protein L7/L12
MNEKIFEIIEKLKLLTLLEASSLVKEIERAFDIKSGLPLQNTVSADLIASVPLEVPEEKTSFELILVEVPSDKKISVLKAVRHITGLGLKESKEVVDNIPRTIRESATKDESESIKKEIEIAGGRALIK